MDNFLHNDILERHILSFIEYDGMTLEEAAEQLLHGFRNFTTVIAERIQILKDEIKTEQERQRKMDIDQSDTFGNKPRAL